MAERLRVDLFCEDYGHESFSRTMVTRLAREEGKEVNIIVRSGRGGEGRALTELKTYQLAAPHMGYSRPDLLVVVIDGNCEGWNKAKSTIQQAVDTSLFPQHVVGCPDPHVERWCLADPIGFRQVVGGAPADDPGKCERSYYKTLLRQSIESAGQSILVDPMDFAPEFVEQMDLYKAGKRQPSLRNFVEALRAALRIAQ